MHENPSAGKFEPPLTPQPPGDHHPRTSWLLIVLIIASSAHWLLPRGRGWVALLTGVIVFGLAILQHVLLRANIDETGRDDPYSPPTSITR